MKIAFYGRYSSHNQRETSIEDQRRVVERWARQHGHEIVAAYADWRRTAAAWRAHARARAAGR